MIDPTNAQRKQIERNIIALVVEHPNAHADEGWQAQLAEQVAALNSTPAEPTPEDEAKANLKAKAEQAQRQGQIRQAEQTILAKAAANSPDHITPENVLTEAPDEVLRVIDTTPDVVIPRVVD